MVMPYLPSFTAPGCTSSSAFYTINNSNNSKINNNKNNNNPTVTSHVVLQHEVRLGVGEQIQDWFGKLNAMRKQSRELAECSHENWPSAATRIYQVEEH